MNTFDKLKIRALKKARGRIATSRDDFICTALMGVSETTPACRAACDYLQRYIKQSLQGYSVLEAWVSQYKPNLSTYAYLNPKESRLAWIDWMINQLEN